MSSITAAPGTIEYTEPATVVITIASQGCSQADLSTPYGTLNFFDVSAFIAAYNAQDSSADLAEPIGTFNFFDVSAYIAAYNAGCP